MEMPKTKEENVAAMQESIQKLTESLLEKRKQEAQKKGERDKANNELRKLAAEADKVFALIQEKVDSLHALKKQ